MAQNGEAISEVLRLVKRRSPEPDELLINKTADHPTLFEQVTVNNDLEPVGVTTKERHNNP
jgi:hypothetical protein